MQVGRKIKGSSGPKAPLENLSLVDTREEWAWKTSGWRGREAYYIQKIEKTRKPTTKNGRFLARVTIPKPYRGQRKRTNWKKKTRQEVFGSDHRLPQTGPSCLRTPAIQGRALPQSDIFMKHKTL